MRLFGDAREKVGRLVDRDEAELAARLLARTELRAHVRMQAHKLATAHRRDDVYGAGDARWPVVVAHVAGEVAALVDPPSSAEPVA